MTPDSAETGKWATSAEANIAVDVAGGALLEECESAGKHMAAAAAIAAGTAAAAAIRTEG